MSQIRFAQVDIDRKDHLLEQPLTVPGIYQWAECMDGAWLEWAEVKGRCKEYDVIMVVLTQWDITQRLISQIKAEAPDTKVIASVDYGMELWNEMMSIAWTIGELEAADYLFAPEPAMRGFIQGIFPDRTVHLLEHPVNIDKLRNSHIPRGRRDDNIIYMVHRYNNYWLSGYCAQRNLSRTVHPLVGTKEQGAKLVQYFRDMAVGGSYTQYVKWAANQMYGYDGYQMMHSFGRFQLDGAVLGIPIVGTKTVHNQNKLFPDLTTESWELDKQIELLQRLIDDSQFWNDVTEKAFDLVQLYGHEQRKQSLMEIVNGTSKTEVQSGREAVEAPTGTG